MKSRFFRFITPIALALITLLALLALSFRFRLAPNVESLLPEHGESASLQRYVRGFGGGDLAVIMVRSPDPEESALVASIVAKELSQKPSVRVAADRIDASRSLDPMLAFRHADARAREKLAQTLTPEGMRARLAETRAMLLAPGSGAAAEVIAEDPLRLAQIVFEGSDIGAGVRTQADGAFASDDGRMHLVLAAPKGQALRGKDAKAFVDDAESVLEPLRRSHPQMDLGITGGHAIAAATEVMLTADLSISGTLAMVLASAVFALIFRRSRALLAVMPPLVLGTVWTAGFASLLPGGLSAIAVAFMSVVVGVGVDTGVHVYAALLAARRDGFSPEQSARIARKKTMRAVLVAASAAAFAFGSLALSDIKAVRQLGLLCAAGELFTAVAIILLTPAIGARLERGTPPAARPSRWTKAIFWLTQTRLRAACIVLIALLPILIIASGHGPELSEAIVAIRPQKLQPLVVQKQIFEAFGGKQGQWVVLVADSTRDKARARSDRIAEVLASMKEEVEAVDALCALAPAPDTQKARFAQRDALNLPAKADLLEQSLKETGFAPSRFEHALSGMRNPSSQMLELDEIQKGAASILVSRYLGEDQGEQLVALYVRPSDAKGSIERVAQAIQNTDPQAMLTGYSRLESSLRQNLRRDIPRIGIAALILVFLALSASLRSARDIIIALLVVTSEIAAVLLLIKLFQIPLHAYDALVIPVLLGITVDEAMFLLHRAREMPKGQDNLNALIADTLRLEGPPIAATALTTAAGFFALVFCDFDGLRDLGMVGALGSSVGLIMALLVVPSGLRLLSRPQAIH